MTSGWKDAYSVDFSGSSGKGARPLVVSYASSPPFEVTDGMTTAPTGALLDTCFRQVEYAGVLAGAKNPAAAQQVVDWLLSRGVPGRRSPTACTSTRSIPPSKLPAAWAAVRARSPPTRRRCPRREITANREAWIGSGRT